MFSRSMLAIALMVLTCVGFMLGRKTWHFGSDDLGAFYSGKTHTLDKFDDYFNGQYTNEMTIMPTNMKGATKSFYSATYRPLTLVFYAIECLALKAQSSFDSWPYFVVSIALHAIGVAMVFWALSFLMGLFFAFFTALAFAFYPFMGRCIGPFSFQPYSVSLILGIICIGLFYRHLKTNNFFWLALSCAAFAVPLFMHEIIILLPLWLIFFAAYFYASQDSESQVSVYAAMIPILPMCLIPFFPHKMVLFAPIWLAIFTIYFFVFRRWKAGDIAFKAFLRALPFFLIGAGYLCARKIALPVDLSQVDIFDPIKMISRFGIRFYDFVTLKVDLLGLSWIPAGHRQIKSIGIMAVFGWYLILYFMTSKKWPSTLMTIGFFCLAWPSYLITHQARYLYLAMPMFLGSIAVCARYITADTMLKFFFKWSVPVVFCAVSVVGLLESRDQMDAADYRYGLATRSFSELANNQELFDKTIFFVGLPHEILPHSGAAQAIWMFGPEDQDGRPVAYDYLLNTKCFFVHNVRDKIPEQNMLKIRRDGDKISVVSTNPDKVWIHIANPLGAKAHASTGKVVESSIYQKGQRAKKITIKLDEEWTGKNVAYVTWDYEKSKFAVFDKEFGA